MYRVVKAKHKSGYAIHKVIKVKNGEISIEAEPLFSAQSLAELRKVCGGATSALSLPTLDRSEVVLVHKTLWNENELPFFEDIADELLEEEFSNENLYNDIEDYSNTRW